MDTPAETLINHFRALSDADLVQVLQQRRADYREEALATAEAEAETRGGLAVLIERVTGEPSASLETAQEKAAAPASSRKSSNFIAFAAVASSLVGLGCYLLYLPAKAKLMISFVALIPWAILGVGVMASLTGAFLAVVNLAVKHLSVAARAFILLLSLVVLVLLGGELTKMTYP